MRIIREGHRYILCSLDGSVEQVIQFIEKIPGMDGKTLLIVGMGFFQLGAEMSMTPLGEGVGRTLAKREKVILVVLVAFAPVGMLDLEQTRSVVAPAGGLRGAAAPVGDLD